MNPTSASEPGAFRSEERLRRIERATDLPLLILAIALIPLLIGPVVIDLSPSTQRTVMIADWMIWAGFAVDFGMKVMVAPQRLPFIRSHWLEAAMVLLPFLRPLRVLRVLRFLRLGAALGLNVQVVSDIASRRGTKVIVAGVIGILVAGASFAFLFERAEEGSNLTSYGDALWWAGVTMATVGYGDHYPITPAGRGIAFALMLFGIAMLSALTATIAAYLVRESEEEVTMSDLLRHIDELRAEVAALRRERDPVTGV